MRCLLLMMLIACLAWPVHAALPDYDVNARCTTVATQSGTLSPAQFKACLDLEQKAYDSVKENWDKLSFASQDYCVQQASTLGMYIVLKGCVDVEYGASQLGDTTFKR